MPVSSHHPMYDDMLEKWQRCRDSAEGSDAVKKRGTRYLPRLEKMTDDQYEAYRMRALWYGATGRTIQGLRGAVFRKSPFVEVPDAGEALNKAITDDNLALEALASEVVTEQLTTGRQGLLVDVAEDGGLPYIARYTPEHIINWRIENVDGREVVVLVVLKEIVWIENTDRYQLEKKARFRVLEIEDGTYQQSVYSEEGDLLTGPIVPRRLGQTLNFIPFRFINVTTLSAEPEKPPLLDLVDVNLSHYRTSADLEHGAHFTALPTPWLAGFDVGKKFQIGSGVAFVSDDVQAKAGMLEFKGDGLKSLEGRADKKEKLMAVLGARLLEEQKKGVEAEGTVRLHHSGESGALSSLTSTASQGIQDVMTWALWWAGIVGDPVDVDDVSFKLNTDFLDVKIPPQMLTALLQSLQGGAISLETWLYNLKQGEILPPEKTIDDEREQLELEGGGDMAQNEAQLQALALAANG